MFYLYFWNCSTTEEDIIVDQVESPEIVDDFELPQQEAIDIKDMQVNKLKLTRRINHFKVLWLFFFILTASLISMSKI